VALPQKSAVELGRGHLWSVVRCQELFEQTSNVTPQRLG